MVGPLPPGTILRLMYLRERLIRLKAGRFIEIGPGRGEITGLLFSEGWRGTAYDLDCRTAELLTKRFAKEVRNGELEVVNENYISAHGESDADLIVSSMVMEHSKEAEEHAFMVKGSQSLRTGA